MDAAGALILECEVTFSYCSQLSIPTPGPLPGRAVIAPCQVQDGVISIPWKPQPPLDIRPARSKDSLSGFV